MSAPEQSDILKAAAARCTSTRFICWFCGTCIPEGEEIVVEDERRAERRKRFYVPGAEGLMISCGCSS